MSAAVSAMLVANVASLRLGAATARLERSLAQLDRALEHFEDCADGEGYDPRLLGLAYAATREARADLEQVRRDLGGR